LTEEDQHMNILVCAGTGCTAGESAKLIDQLNEEIKEADLSDRVRVIKTGCFGFCQKGPIVAIYPDKVFYTHVKPDNAKQIVQEHVIGGRIIQDLQMFDTSRIDGS
jgi:(2Fe-2S) ferredoxin